MKKLLILIMLAALFTACIRKMAPAQANSQQALQNTRWKLSMLPGVSDSLFNLEQAAYIRFDSTNRANGYAGCNSFFGTYITSGTSLHFTQIGSTKKYCMKGMEVENAFLKALNDTHNFKIAHSQLSLMQGDQILATFEKEETDP